MFNISPRTLEIIKASLLTTANIAAWGAYYKYFFENRTLKSEIEILKIKLSNYDKYTKH